MVEVPGKGSDLSPHSGDPDGSDNRERASDPALDGLQNEVLRCGGTERAFTSPLYREKRDGRYLCAGCGAPLFTSAAKYESGTGWPSFFQALPGAFAFSQDHTLGMTRTEYHCARCGGHHGHLFEDGPQPTGQRFCNNGVALKFEPGK
jgi:peptide-methionine (R)-S-oxide reductase